MRQNRTREERKARAALRVKIIACLVLLAVMAVCMVDAAAKETPVSGKEYLASINADNAQRAHVAALYEEWER